MPVGPDARRIALVVVNYRTAARVESLASALGEACDAIVVVDNSACEGIDGPSISRLPPGAAIVAPGRNLGYGAGANLGAAQVPDVDVLVVANPDLRVDPGALRRLVGAVGYDGVAVVAPRVVDAAGTVVRATHDREPGLVTTAVELAPAIAAALARLRPGWHPTLAPASVEDRTLDCAHVLGALLVLDAPRFRSVGGFDESFFLYREETDLCRRLRLAGGRVRHVGDVTVEHEGGASTPQHGPVFARSVVLASHYRYIRIHHGAARAALARLVGLVAALSWCVTGPDRRAAAAAARWHLGRTR